MFSADQTSPQPLSSTVGRKLIMAVTGQMMVLFIIAHVVGNFTIFYGAINAYAAGLRAVPLLLWAFRLVLFAAFALHVYYAIQLTLENSDARPLSYARTEHVSSSFAGRNMVWTGAAIGTFLTFHLLHFTFQVIDPAKAAVTHPDALGRPDVFSMVVSAFRHFGITALYAAGLTAVWLHLSHGIQSSFQTWGLNGERSFPYLQKGGSFAAIALLLAYAAIPAAIAAGLLTK
jgi:succinate dehydrogenase / fumarate reductase cytochrome b subunit